VPGAIGGQGSGGIAGPPGAGGHGGSAGGHGGSAGASGALLQALAVATSGATMCVVLLDRTVACWGYNVQGQVGNGTSTNILTPSPVSNLTGASTIDTSGGTSCAILLDGTLSCWGNNYDGELGVDNPTASSPCLCSETPITVPGLAGVRAVAIGGNHTCALLAGGAVYCWGLNYYGELGNGTSSGAETSTGGLPYVPAPGQVAGISGATAIAAGMSHTCAVLADTTVACWGANSHGQLGNGTTTNVSAPVLVTGLTGAVALAAGAQHTCALLADKTVVCWGGGTRGQLGNGGMVDSPTPVPVDGLTGVTAVSTSPGLQSWSTCALLADTTARCWGSSQVGQLGDGVGNEVASSPVAVLGLTGITALSEGQNGGCALLADSSVACWGNTASSITELTPTLVRQ
jgi:hypothetical protein